MNIYHFVPRLEEKIGFLDIPLTADTTMFTADTTKLTADATKYFIEGDFVIEMTNEMTQEVTYPEFEWEFEGNFIKVIFTDTYTEKYSLVMYNNMEEKYVIHKGRFIPVEYKAVITNTNKLYI